MDFIQEFKKLAAELQKEDVMVYLAQAKKMNDMDQELQDLIGNFNLTRFNLNTEISKDDKDESVVSNLNNQLSAIYAQIMENDSMQAYEEAKNEADKVVKQFQAVMSAVINGEDPMAVEFSADSCGGSCSSCSGCH